MHVRFSDQGDPLHLPSQALAWQAAKRLEDKITNSRAIPVEPRHNFPTLRG